MDIDRLRARLPRPPHRLLPGDRFHHARRRRAAHSAPSCWPTSRPPDRAATATPGTPNRGSGIYCSMVLAAHAAAHPGPGPRRAARHRRSHRHGLRPALAQRPHARRPQSRRHPGASWSTATPSPASASTSTTPRSRPTLAAEATSLRLAGRPRRSLAKTILLALLSAPSTPITAACRPTTSCASSPTLPATPAGRRVDGAAARGRHRTAPPPASTRTASSSCARTMEPIP